MIDQHDNLSEIENHLKQILAATDELDESDTIGVEQAAQRIHVCFGGTDKEAIYPDNDQNSVLLHNRCPTCDEEGEPIEHGDRKRFICDTDGCRVRTYAIYIS